MTDPVDPEGRVALALAALGEVTDPGDIGALLTVVEPEPGVVDLRFATTSAAYTGWQWTVSTASVAGEAPTVLEVELMPGEGSLLAPAWVPWAERLAEWRKAHPNERTPADDEDEDDDHEDDEDDDGLEDDDRLDGPDDLLDDDVLDDEVDVEGVDQDEADPDEVDPGDDDPDDDGEPGDPR